MMARRAARKERQEEATRGSMVWDHLSLPSRAARRRVVVNEVFGRMLREKATQEGEGRKGKEKKRGKASFADAAFPYSFQADRAPPWRAKGNGRKPKLKAAGGRRQEEEKKTVNDSSELSFRRQCSRARYSYLALNGDDAAQLHRGRAHAGRRGGIEREEGRRKNCRRAAREGEEEWECSFALVRTVLYWV